MAATTVGLSYHTKTRLQQLCEGPIIGHARTKATVVAFSSPICWLRLMTWLALAGQSPERFRLHGHQVIPRSLTGAAA